MQQQDNYAKLLVLMMIKEIFVINAQNLLLQLQLEKQVLLKPQKLVYHAKMDTIMLKIPNNAFHVQLLQVMVFVQNVKNQQEETEKKKKKKKKEQLKD